MARKSKQEVHTASATVARMDQLRRDRGEDWCSKEDGSIIPDEPKGAVALDTLANDLLASEFEESGRSRVLYLHPWSTKARMTRDWLKDARQHDLDGDHGRSEYLAHCWLSRRMFERWLVKHPLPESPAHFQPRRNPSNSSTSGRDRRRRKSGDQRAGHILEDQSRGFSGRRSRVVSDRRSELGVRGFQFPNLAGGAKTGRLGGKSSAWAQTEIVALKSLRQFFCDA